MIALIVMKLYIFKVGAGIKSPPPPPGMNRVNLPVPIPFIVDPAYLFYLDYKVLRNIAKCSVIFPSCLHLPALSSAPPISRAPVPLSPSNRTVIDDPVDIAR